MNKWTNITNVKASQIRQRLVRSVNNEPLNRIMNTYNIMIPPHQNPFIDLRRITNITQLRILQYKTLLNFYPTKILLFKWGVADNDRCPHCDQRETVNHVVMECDIATSTFNELNLIISKADREAETNYGPLSKENIITLHDIPPDLATIVILIKNKLLKQKDIKRPLSEHALLSIIKDQHDIEQRIAHKTKKLTKHNRKWHFLKPVILLE